MTISENSQPSSKKRALFIEKLSYCIGNNPILKDVSLHVNEGELVSLFGPNGGGKTSLLNLIMGFLKPTSGKIQLLGKSPKRARCDIGYVPQNFRPDPLFPISVKEVVGLGNRDPLEALAKVDMLKFANAPFNSLSGGQAARVLLARALAGNPKLLLLDEAVANVDPDATAAIYQMLVELKGSMTIIMVTHDLNGALAISDRLYSIHQMAEEHPKESLCHHYAQGLYHEEEGS